MSSRLLALSVLLMVSTQVGAQQSKADPKKNSGPTGGVSEAAKNVIDKRAGQLSGANKLKQTQAQRTDPTQSVLQTAAKPWFTIVDYSKAWKEITASRAKIAGHRLSAKETAMLKALDMPLKVDFAKTRFRDVLAYLAEKSGQPITVPEVTLEEAEVDYDSVVTLKIVKPVAMRSILRKVLRDHGLTYVMKDETIQVVTPERSRQMMVVRVHAVMDLCGPVPSNDSPFNATNRNALHLMRIIQNMIEPELWDINDGAASITYQYSTVTLTVRAPAELHLRLGVAGFGTSGR